jgi:hypothetical protein
LVAGQRTETRRRFGDIPDGKIVDAAETLDRVA